jgi:hypothetical protein
MGRLITSDERGLPPFISYLFNLKSDEFGELEKFLADQQNISMPNASSLDSAFDDNVFVGNGYHFAGNGEPIDCVNFVVGRISIFHQFPGVDGLSTNFSGCLMARFRLNGHYYVAHIATSAFNQNNTMVNRWYDFVAINKRNIDELSIFCPDSCVYCTPKKVDLCMVGISSWGLILRNGKCYTLFVKRFRSEENKWNQCKLEAVYEHSPLFLGNIG